MKSLKDTKTEKNLLTAFAGESQARNRYTFFASQAKKDGYEQIAAFFEETADNEKEHAKLFFKYLEGGMVEITGTFPAGKIGTTAENLLASANGEHEEWSLLYPDAAKIARSEGFEDIAKTYEEVAKVEAAHENRYRKLLEDVQNGKVFKKDKAVSWKCRNCGYVHNGQEAPEACPACKHAKKFFEVLAENY